VGDVAHGRQVLAAGWGVEVVAVRDCDKELREAADVARQLFEYEASKVNNSPDAAPAKIARKLCEALDAVKGKPTAVEVLVLSQEALRSAMQKLREEAK
jgi:hypothetical protein